MLIRTGTVHEAVGLAKRIPDFFNPYNLLDPDTPPPQLDHILIAEEAGTLVGFRAGSRHSSDTFAVWLAGVLPEYRKRGIGGALYRAQKEWLRSQGYRFLRTHVRNSNRVMLKILVEHGYHVVEVVSHGDVARNKIIFVKNLWSRDKSMNAAALVVGLLKPPAQDQDRDLQSWLRDKTISWLRFKYSGRIIEESSVDAILNRACQSGHQMCWVLTPGTIVSHAWELGLVRTMEAWAQERDFVVAGRILREDDAACGVSPRGLLVNLRRYAELSNPGFGEPDDSPVTVSLPAEMSIADEQDVLLRASGDSGLRQARQPGWDLVSKSLAAGIPVHGLPESIAATLVDITPDNHRQAESLKCLRGSAIATRDLDPQVLSGDQIRFLTGVQRQVQNSRRGIFVWNFESYDDVSHPPVGFQPPISALYSVAAGLKTNWILQSHGFDGQTRLVYFDYSEQALQFKRLLHDEWNGEDYPDFLQGLFRRIPPGEAYYQLWGGFSPADMEWDKVTEAWDRELSRWGGETVIRENWRRVKDLRVDYVLCNILENQQPLLEKMDDRPNAVIWWSNVFFTFFSNWFHTIDERREIYEGFIRRLSQRNPGALIYGHDYNNIVLTGIRTADYVGAYFRSDENPLEPRSFSH